jgi:hypothetical protein
MSEQRIGLSPDKLRAVNLLAGSGFNRADTEDCDSEAVAGSLGGDPEFIPQTISALSTDKCRSSTSQTEATET